MVSGVGGSWSGGDVTGDVLCSVEYRAAEAPVEVRQRGRVGGRERGGGEEGG